MALVKHIVFFSGGVGSAATALRLLSDGIDRDSITLLFTDTKIEDPDLYRFIEEFAAVHKLNLQVIADGRTPIEVFKDVRWLGNSRLAQCSHILKQETSRKWVQANCTVEGTTLYIGIDWSEIHRLKKSVRAWKPYHLEAPLCNAPYLDKLQCMDLIVKSGVSLPSLYSKGFSHNNCGGGCVRAGKAQWRNLFKTFPDRYAIWEGHEKEMQEFLGRPVTILKDISLTQLRESVEAEHRLGVQLDLFDIGGCGCFLD